MSPSRMTTTATESLAVLLVEDDEDDFFITRSLLARAASIDCDLTWARSYDEGLTHILTGRYDAALVDYRLGARDGLELLREATEQGCRTPIILLTGQGDLEVDLSAMSAGAADYLSKAQIDAPLLERSIRYARERQQAEQRIREQAALLDKARDAIMAFDLDERVVYWNKSAERLTGWTAREMEGRRAADRLYAADQQARLDEAHATMRAAGEWTGELKQRTKGGDTLTVESRWTLVRDDAGAPASILVINTDITERKRLEAQFLRTQRMESIGRLVGGIAHDLGNLLVPILLGAEVLQRRFDDDRTTRTLDMIQKSAQRGSDMVQQVLAFARGVEGERAPLHVGAILDEVRGIVGETFPNAIDVTVDVADDLPRIVGDATQIQQVLMNLCVNARDAMLEQPGGVTTRDADARLTLRADAVTLDAQSVRRTTFDAQPGAYVCLAVEDTGAGMPPEVVDKIFEPFYSTKPEGKGTGLGLSTAYSIVKSHDGFIDVESAEGEGTAFRVFLPVTKARRLRDLNGAAPDAAATTTALRPGAGERILVIDDEDGVRDAARESLEDAGYHAVTARGGAEALALAAREPFDAVVTDLMMPEMHGLEVIRRLRAAHPALPIIAASGLADGRTDEALEAGARSFLAKPFTAATLQAALQKALREGR
jgi:PAS domain S-box-containing protein